MIDWLGRADFVSVGKSFSQPKIRNKERKKGKIASAPGMAAVRQAPWEMKWGEHRQITPVYIALGFESFTAVHGRRGRVWAPEYPRFPC